MIAKKDVTVFECEICGRVGSSSEIAAHEPGCKAELHKLELKAREYLYKVANRLTQARKIATDSESIKLLCVHGHYADARILCNHKARLSLWDCGTSHGWEEVYDAMVEAAKQHVHPQPVTQ